MRGQRGKQQDWSKPFKMIFSKSQFQDLQTGDDTVINIPTKQNITIVKQQIITPNIETVKRVTEVKPFAKIHPNYVRLASHLSVPKVNDYELTEIDHVFIQTHREKFKLNGKAVLTQQFLKNIIIALQTRQGKDSSIPRTKGVLTAYLERQHKELMKMQNYDHFTDMLYNYWRNRRQQLKFPLFRPLWRPNQDEYNHLLAFKFREKQKRSLRRSSRTSEQDILQQMANELSTALKVAQRVQLRQQLKQKQVEVQLNLFHQELKSIFPPPEFINSEGATQENRNKDRQKIRKYNNQVQKIRKQRQIKNQEYKQPQIPTIFDQKESVVNFLATVVAQAELCNLSYDKIFHYKSQPLPPIPIPGSPHRVDVDVAEIQQQEFLNLSLKRAGDYLLRSFEQDDDSEDSSTMEGHVEVNPIKRQMINQKYEDIFDFRKKLVSRFYFGDDDQGDYQNLRKNISASFKKFQSTKDSS